MRAPEKLHNRQKRDQSKCPFTLLKMGFSESPQGLARVCVPVAGLLPSTLESMNLGKLVQNREGAVSPFLLPLRHILSLSQGRLAKPKRGRSVSEKESIPSETQM